MKFRWLVIVFVLGVVGATMFTAFAGHNQISRFSGSVETEGSSVVRTGGDVRVEEFIVPVPPATGIEGIAICGNPGKKLHAAPGINPVTAFGGEIIIPASEIEEGHGRFAYAITSEADLFAIDAKEVCPNGRWTVKSFVPTRFDSYVIETALLDGGIEESLGFTHDRCSLPDPETYEPGERRQYDCVTIQTSHN